MVASSDFSGLTSAACALASAEASAATVSLDRGMDRLRLEQVKADCARFGALRPHPMPNRFLGVLRNKRLELAFGTFMIQVGRAGGAEERSKFGPRVRRAHVNDADGLDARARRLGIDEVRQFAKLHAAPELLLRRDQDAEIER